MAQSHLSTEQLLALRDGDLANSTDVEHLASCPVCREAFDDTRWALLLRQLPEIVDSGPHPSPDELLAFRSYAMSSPRVMEIRRHLRSCQRCLAIYGRARAADKRVAYASPSPDVLGRVQRRFRPRRLRTVGTLVVEQSGEGLRVFFTPERPPEPLARLESPLAAGHPGAASFRARRIAACEPEPLDCVSGIRDLMSEAPPVRFEAGSWTVEMTPLARNGRPSFGIRVRTADSDEPVGGAVIRIVPQDGEATDGITDDDGQVVLAFRSGRSQIRIGSSPPTAVDLEFP